MEKEEVEEEKVWKGRCLFLIMTFSTIQLNRHLDSDTLKDLSASSNLSLILSVSQLLMGLGTLWSV